jgi:uncharacterized LabA/DUF88 family protein
VITPETRLKIAVFIDFDNIEIGVKSTLNTNFDIGPVLEALKERGEVVSKTAYSDWKRAGDYSRSLSQHAIKMVQRNLTPGGDKNGADINLALDALEMAFTHPHINAYVIVGGDSDFITLVEKLKQYDKKVLVVGGRSFTSNIMQRNCHEFIAYENLVGPSHSARRSQERGAARAPRTERTAVAQAIPLVKRALEVLADREVSPQLGLLKSTLLQLDSTFSERNFGANSFRDFAEKLETAGLVTLRHAGRNILVELKGGQDEAPVPEGPETARGSEFEPPDIPEEPLVEAVPAPRPEPPSGNIGDVRRILARSKPQRFPMYIRNVKQLLRQTEPGFDEHKYGFSNVVDLLRALQRDGMVRLERDRQGALRVFQGPAWAQAPALVEVELPQAAREDQEPTADSVVVPEETGVYLETAVDDQLLPAEVLSGGEAEVPAVTKRGRRPSRKAKAPAGVEVQPEKARKPRAAKAAKSATPRRRSRKTLQPEVE